MKAILLALVAAATVSTGVLAFSGAACGPEEACCCMPCSGPSPACCSE